MPGGQATTWRQVPSEMHSCQPEGQAQDSGQPLAYLPPTGGEQAAPGATAPTVTRSMRTALQDLRLDEIVVVHAGSRSYSLDRKIRAIPLDRILEDILPLK